jgi:hypothetical protein
MPDSDDPSGSEQIGHDLSGSEPPKTRFGWVNHPLVSSVLFLGLVAVAVIVALFFLRDSHKPDYGPCGPAAACSVSNAPP